MIRSTYLVRRAFTFVTCVGLVAATHESSAEPRLFDPDPMEPGDAVFVGRPLTKQRFDRAAQASLSTRARDAHRAELAMWRKLELIRSIIQQVEDDYGEKIGEVPQIELSKQDSLLYARFISGVLSPSQHEETNKYFAGKVEKARQGTERLAVAARQRWRAANPNDASREDERAHRAQMARLAQERNRALEDLSSSANQLKHQIGNQPAGQQARDAALAVGRLERDIETLKQELQKECGITFVH